MAESALEYARRKAANTRLNQQVSDRFSKLPGGQANVESLWEGATNPIVAAGERVFGGAGAADATIHHNQTVQAAMGERDAATSKKYGLPPVILDAARGAAANLPPMLAAGAVGGPGGAIAYAATQEGNEAITGGRDAGLKGTELAMYVGAKATVEAGIAAAMSGFGRGGFSAKNKFGLGGLGSTGAAGGLENQVAELFHSKAGQEITKKSLLESAKNFGLAMTSEQAEELATETMHAIAEKSFGVDPHATDPESLLERWKQTVAQTAMMGATVGAAGSAAGALGRFNDARKQKQDGKPEAAAELPPIPPTVAPAQPVPPAVTAPVSPVPSPPEPSPVIPSGQFPTADPQKASDAIRGIFADGKGRPIDDIHAAFGSEHEDAINKTLEGMISDGELEIADGEIRPKVDTAKPVDQNAEAHPRAEDGGGDSQSGLNDSQSSGGEGDLPPDAVPSPEATGQPAAEPPPEATVEAETPQSADNLQSLKLDPSRPAEDSIADFFTSGGRIKNIVDARKAIGEATGETIKPGTTQAKDADELIERGVVKAARSILRSNIDQQGTPDVSGTYDKLTDLYARQPRLGVRTSDSRTEQAYSTPVPLAYLSNVLGDVRPGDATYDSSAGNGALLIASDNPHANELNKSRAAGLVAAGVPTTQEDATAFDNPQKFARIQINPPFGKHASKKNHQYMVDGKGYSQMDHAIALKTLKSMDQNGKAVLILGARGAVGNGKTDRDRGVAYRNQKRFYDSLYQNYNVTDHFTVAGDLYSKQGTKFPVDVIVVDGHGTSARLKPYQFLDGGLPKVYNSWESLKDDKLKPAIAGYQQPRPAAVDAGVGGRPGTTGLESSPRAGDTDQGIGSDDRLGNVPGQTGQTDSVGSEPGSAPDPNSAKGVGGTNGPGLDGGQPDSGRGSQPGVRGDAEQQGDQPGIVSDGDRQQPGSDEGDGGKPGDEAGPTVDAPGNDLSEDELDAYMQKLYEQEKASKQPEAKTGPKKKPPREGGKRKPGQPKPPTKLQDAAKAAQDKVKDDLAALGKKARELFGNQGQASMGLNPELAIIAIKLAGSITDAGVKTFAAYVEQVYNAFPDLINQLAPYLESAWRVNIKNNPDAGLSEVGSTAAVVESLKTPDPVTVDKPLQDDPSEFQSTYTTTSKGTSVGSLIPKNQVAAFERRLDYINEKYGNIDAFVAKELNFDIGQVIDGMSSEQIEAIGMAIAAHKEGVSFIIGDQCVGGETRIYDPVANKYTPIKELVEAGVPITVLSLTAAGMVPMQASVPFLKGTADLYRVTMDDGRSMTVTKGHRFLTPSGWRSLDDGLREGHFLASVEDLQGCNSESSRLAHAEGAPHSSRRPEDCLSGCSSYHRQCDGQLQPGSDIGLAPAPSQDDVHGHSRALSRMGGQSFSTGHSRLYLRNDHRSKSNSSPSEIRDPSSTSVQAFVFCEPPLQSKPQEQSLFHSGSVLLRPATSAAYPRHNLLGDCSVPTENEYRPDACEASSLHDDEIANAFSGSCRCSHQQDTDRRSTSRCEAKESQVFGKAYSSWRMVVSVVFSRRDSFYDMKVPISHNYVSEGLVSHNTGVGKGRVVAGLMQYAMTQGMTPVFVTEKTSLMTDMMRDLTDIGVNSADRFFNPYITNAMNNAADQIDLHAHAEHLGSRVVKATAAQTRETGDSIMKSIAKGNGLATERARSGKKPVHYDAVFTTYSQMAPRGKETWRHGLFRAIAPNAFFIFDESHNAGGQETSNRSATNKDGSPRAPSTSEFARELAAASRGNLFSSATFAKNPSVMTLYATTGLEKALPNINDLPEMVKRGGIPLQQVISGQMADAGVYARRERSYKGIEFKTKEIPVDLSKVDEITDKLRWIKTFDDAKNKILSSIADRIISDGGYVARDPSTGSVGIDSANFSSINHNIVDQLLMAAKAEVTAAEAIKTLRLPNGGEKPVIVLEKTGESSLNNYIEAENSKTEDTGVDAIKTGDEINFRFNTLLHRYLQRSREITIKPDRDDDSTWIRRSLTDEELGPFATNLFHKVRQEIESLESDLPASPIDLIRKRITEAGFTVAEITGRKRTIDYQSDGSMRLGTRPQDEIGNAGKTLSAKRFNDGSLDALILNRSGSTGISLHASSKFKDLRKRHMIVAEAAKNVDEFMQALGRIHRTGQVVKPEYTLLTSDVPAESRPASIVAKKLSGLNASVTSASAGDVQFNVPDIMNVVGDEIVRDYLEDQRDIASEITIDVPENSIPEGFARKVSGRVSLLRVAQQKDFWSKVVDAYVEQIAELDAANANPLSAKTLNMDAKLQERFAITDGTPGSKNPFEQPAYLERVDSKVQVKPMTKDQINQAITEGLNGEDTRTWYEHTFGLLRADMVHFTQGLQTEDPRRAAALSRLEVMQSRLRFFSPGTVAYITTGTSSENRTIEPAIVLGWKRLGRTKDPTSLSDFTLEVVTGDEGRRSKIRGSKIGRTINLEPRAIDFDVALKEIEQLASGAREERFVGTGNLLSAYGSLANGKIVFYTDDKGSTQQGILMPKKFDADAWQEARPVIFRVPAEVLGFLRAGGSLTSADFTMIATVDGDMLKLRTPLSVQRAGKYTQNQAILNAAGAVFVSSGDSMVMQVHKSRALGTLAAILDVAPLQAGTQTQKALARNYSSSVSRKVTGEASGAVKSAPPLQPVPAVSVAPSTPVRKPGDMEDGIAAQDIIKTMSRLFGVPFTVRKLGKGVLGEFIGLSNKNTVPQVISLSEGAALDVATMMHEVAHFIDRVTAISHPNLHHANPQMPSQFHSVIQGLDYEPKNRLYEGFAEYMRRWLMEDNIQDSHGNWDGGVRKETQDFTHWFEHVWMKNPAHKEFADALHETKNYVRKYQDQSLFQTLRTLIGNNPGSELDPGVALRQTILSNLTAFRRKWTDSLIDLRHIDDATNAAGGLGLLRATATFYDQYENSAALRALENGVHDPMTDQMIGKEGFISVAQETLHNDEEMEEWKTFGLARATLFMAKKRPGYNTSMGWSEAIAWMDHIKKTPEKLARYERLAVALSNTADDVREMQVRAGSLSRDDVKRMKAYYGDNYFPLRRAMEGQSSISTGGRGFVNLAHKVKGKTQSGSGRPVLDPFDQIQKILIDAYRNAGQSRVNEALRVAIDPAFGGLEGMGWIGFRVPPTNKPTDTEIIPVLEDLVQKGIMEPDELRSLMIANKATGRIVGRLTASDIGFYVAHHGLDPNQDMDPHNLDSKTLLQMLKQPSLDQMVRTWKPMYESSPGKLTALSYGRDGKPIIYKYDKDIYETITGGPPGTVNSIVSAARFFSRQFKSLVVASNVTFGGGNLFRDYINFQGRAKNVKGFKSLTAPLKEGREHIRYKLAQGAGVDQSKLDSLQLAYDRAGGSNFNQVGATSESRVRNAVRMVSKTKLGKLGIKPNKPSTYLRGAANAYVVAQGKIESYVGMTDAPARLAEMKAKIESLGYTPLTGGNWLFKVGNTANIVDSLPEHVLIQGMMAAGNATVNFKQAGSMARTVDAFIPFFVAGINANKRHLYLLKNLKNISKNDEDGMVAKRTATYIAAMFVTSAIYYAMRRDDDDYKESEDWLLNRYWTFGSGGTTYLRVPKPQDEAIYSNIAEAVLSQIAGDVDTRSLLDVLEYEGWNRAPSGGGPVMALAEIAMNKDTFRDRPIVPEYMKDRKAWNQTDDSTVALSDFFGQYTGAIGISPLVLEHFVNGVTGGQYERLANTASDAANGRMSVENVPGLRAFGMSRHQARSIGDVYDRVKELNGDKDDQERRLEMAAKSGDTQSASTIAQQLQATREESARLDDYREVMTKISAAQKELPGNRFQLNPFIVGLARQALKREPIESSIDPFEVKSLSDLPESIRQPMSDFVIGKVKKGVLRQGFPQKEVYADGATYAEKLEQWKSSVKESIDWLQAHKESELVQDVIKQQKAGGSYKNLVQEKRPEFRKGKESANDYSKRVQQWNEKRAGLGGI